MRKSKKSQQLPDTTNDIEALFRPKFFEQPIARVINLYLCGPIQGAEEYVEWFQILRGISENDVVYIRINSEGGDLFATLQLVRAIEECKGHVIVSVEGICMSAATLIFLAGHSYEVSDHTMFMFHNYSSGAMGKGGEMYDQITHFRTWSEKLFTSFYKDFLTNDEIKSMLDNKDIWMDAQEVIKRLQKLQKPDEVKNKTRSKRTKKIEKPQETSDEV